MVHGTDTGTKIDSFSDAKKHEECRLRYWRNIRCFDGKLSYGEIIHNYNERVREKDANILVIKPR